MACAGAGEGVLEAPAALPRRVGRPRGEPAAAACGPDPDWELLAHWLPRLGPMLCLEQLLCRQSVPTPCVVARAGVTLAGHARCLLGDCARLSSHVRVTSDGPREWMICHGADGRRCAKLFLLPDADWLAWDEMHGDMRLQPECAEPAAWSPHWGLLRTALLRMGNAWRARVLCFSEQQISCRRLLQAAVPARLSPIGLERARMIAADHGTELLDTLCVA